MDCLIGFDAPLCNILIYLDLEMIERCIQFPVSHSKYPFPFNFTISKEIKRIVTTEFFIECLCKRFDLLPVKTYKKFEKLWLKKRLFHHENNLDIILQNYGKRFRLTKALKKAAKYSRFDFVDEILDSKRLWCSFRHIQAVCKGCCWSKQNVDYYLEYFTECHWEIIQKEKEYYELYEMNYDTDISEICSIRATIKGYKNSGYEINNNVYLPSLFVHQRWDDIRSRIDELRENRISLPRYCLELGNCDIFFNQDLIPKDLRYYVDITTIEEAVSECADEISVKGVKRLNVDSNIIPYGVTFSYQDRIKNLCKTEWLKANGLNSNRTSLIQFMFYIDCNPHPKADSMPLFSSTYVPVDRNDHHPERCTEFVIWCLEENLHKSEEFCSRVYKNMKYVFELLLAKTEFQGQSIWVEWYDPLSIQYFCDNHLAEFSEFCGGKDKLKKRLLNRVKGDMEKYVSEL